MNTIVDGHAIAHKIKDTLKKDVVKFHTPIELSIIVVGNNAVTNTFVAAKERFASDIGVVLTKKRFSESVSSADLISYIHEVSERVQGIVVQLPLSAHISNKEVLAAIPVEKDIDLLNKETFDNKFNTLKIDLEDYAKGFYLLNLKNNQKNKKLRFVKK